MKRMIFLALVGTGFVVTTPFASQALDLEKVGQNFDVHSERLRQREPNMLIAQYDRDLYRDNLYRRDRYRDRQFSVYYRDRGDRQWNLASNHNNRRDAQRAANRLERRGYRTYIEVSRRVYRGMGRD